MVSKIIYPILLLAIGCLFAGCTQEDKSSQPTKASTEKTEPVGEVIIIDPALASTGEKIYNQNCIFCHQADAIGKPGFAPSLINQEFLSVASDKFLLSTIRDGRSGTGMPPFQHLGKNDVMAIVAYLRAHAKRPNISARVDAQPRSQGDQRLGRFWFESICATCHGPNGDGYVAGSTGTAIGKAGFLDKATDGFIRETIKKGRTNTRMIGYSGPEAMAALTDADIDDIIAYLRTVPSKSL